MKRLIAVGLAALVAGCGASAPPNTGYTHIQCIGDGGKSEINVALKNARLCLTSIADLDWCYDEANGTNRLRTGSAICVIESNFVLPQASPQPSATAEPQPTETPTDRDHLPDAAKPRVRK